jgi:hypothetical protein
MEERTQMCPAEWKKELRDAPLNGRKNTCAPLNGIKNTDVPR